MENQGFDYKSILTLILRKRWLFVTTALIIITVSVIISYSLPKLYESKCTVFIEKNVIGELIKGMAVTPSMDQTQTIRVLKVSMTSRPLLEKVIKELDMISGNNSDAAINDTLARINKNLSVSVSNENNMFVISYRDKNPRKARDFANTLVRSYIEQNVSSKREESYGAIKFFSEQGDEVKKKIELMDKEIAQYRSQQGGVINIDEARLFSEINAAQQRLHEVQLRIRQLDGIKPVTRREADPLNAQLTALQKRRDELSNQFNDNYPELIRVKGEIDSLKAQIKSRPASLSGTPDPVEVSRIEAELNALRITEKTLGRSIASNQAILSRIPSAKAGLEQLEVERRNQKALYDQILSRQGQSEVSKQIEVQDKTTTYRIVEPAILSTHPVSPNRLRIMLLGIVAGIAAGIGVLISLDLIDNSIKSVDTLKSYGFMVLAVVPQIPDKQKELKINQRDRRLSILSGIYLSLMLGIIALEAAGFPYLDMIFARILSIF